MFQAPNQRRKARVHILHKARREDDYYFQPWTFLYERDASYLKMPPVFKTCSRKQVCFWFIVHHVLHHIEIQKKALWMDWQLWCDHDDDDDDDTLLHDLKMVEETRPPARKNWWIKYTWWVNYTENQPAGRGRLILVLSFCNFIFDPRLTCWVCMLCSTPSLLRIGADCAAVWITSGHKLYEATLNPILLSFALIFLQKTLELNK